jgi:predicted AAA+ superfamily ATPase
MLNGMQLGKYIEDKKELIKKLDVKDRELKLTPRKNLITTVIGPRRAGKTYLFYYHCQKFGLDDCLYLNFEDIELEDSTKEDVLKFIQLFEELSGKKPEYLFFDEIQSIIDWEKAVNEIFERKEMNIFITGSSSKLLAKEIATQLRGRGVKYILLPLSFKEYLGFKKWKFKKIYSTSQENQIKGLLRKYLEHGGFPDIVFDPDAGAKFFEQYIDLVIYRDLVERFGIKNLHLLKTLIRSILSSYSKEVSIHRIFKIIKSQGIAVSKKTLYNYFEYLQDAMFCFILQKFSYSLRTAQLSIPKIYLCDIGLATLSGRFEIGRSMENMVFLELKRWIDTNPSLKIYYWSDYNYEVDFLLKDDDEIKTLIQVTYELTPDNYKREIVSLLKASELLGCLDLRIITWDEDKDIEVDGKIIKVTPLWRWLSEEH